VTPREPAPAEQVAAERAIICECYDRLFAGDSVTALVRDLNARQVTTVTGKQWSRATLSRTLCRATLAGLVMHGGEVVTELVNTEPVVSREKWERMCSLFAARKRGRPPSPVHLLSGLMRCAQCGTTLVGAPRRQLPPYPDGSFKREYRCRRTNDPNRPGCGANHIDGLTADRIVAVAVKARLGDPRRAQRIAQRLARVREQRAGIEADIARWDEAADDLAAKTAVWGVARVDKAIAPILREVAKLRDRLAGLDEPEDHRVAAADAAHAWDEAAERGDFPVLRAMIRRALPNLTLRMPARWGDHSVDRFAWDGTDSGEPPGLDETAS